jgi:KUP system potassium uptake protein
VLLAIAGEERPYVPDTERIELRDFGNGFYRLVARFGFMETPDVPNVLERARLAGLSTDPATTSYYLGRETLLTGGKSGMARWRKRLFAVMSQNARSPTAFFNLPPGRVIELGMQIAI